MIYIIAGVLGVILMAFVARSLYAYAIEARRIQSDRPFGGAVPSWVSLLFLASCGAIAYGLYKVIFV